MNAQNIILIGLAFLLFSFKEKETAKPYGCIDPGKEPLYGGFYVAKLKPNTKVFETFDKNSNVIFVKSCYVEVLGQTGEWVEVVNRPTAGEPDFTGYVHISNLTPYI